ncbi:hypothetical protein Dsin_019083 [Dipteronia sinensis]|uniref:Retrotransposon gag domain-containing protein n=1 Tax=Dipteronia sinensis TaxID=43782 RepID=A0AAE0A6H7_9ROSI|nr:hypothetical protein Dsin_019083 [Dipteronia sinensis]
MKNSRDGSQSPHDVSTSCGVNNFGPANASIVGGDLPSATPTSTGQAAISYMDIPPKISLDAFWQVQESLRGVIEDAARQGINVIATANLTSPYQLSMPVVAQDPKDVPANFGGSRSRWFGGLTSGSIRNFKELIQAFTRQFMGNIQRRKSMSVLSTLKQKNVEKLKDYLTRFS